MPATVQLDYDLDSGTLLRNIGSLQNVNLPPLPAGVVSVMEFSEDRYASSGIDFGTPGPVTVVPDASTFSDTLRVEIDFIDAETDMPQTLTIKSLGTAAAQGMPQTFATREPGSTGQATEPPSHVFDPGLFIGYSALGPAPFTLDGRITVKDPFGPLAADFGNQTPAVQAPGGPNQSIGIGPYFNDLVDGDSPLSFSGITLDLTFSGLSAPVQVFGGSFRLLSAQIETFTTPVRSDFAPQNGGPGDDQLTGNDSNETFNGGGGNDTLLGAGGHDSLRGEDGNDELRGGRGHDVLLGGSGNDQVFGDTGDDTLLGGGDNDTLSGEAGNDRLFGEAGDDFLSGGSGTDFAFGGDGNDRLFDAEGDDRLHGDAGDDILSGGLGQDTLVGGPGTDRFQFVKGEADGDTVIDFAPGETLRFLLYGPGASATSSSQFGNTTLTIQFTGGTEAVSLLGVSNLDPSSIVFES
jgi:Ca2+-binding RTX toxin-like protein